MPLSYRIVVEGGSALNKAPVRPACSSCPWN